MAISKYKPPGSLYLEGRFNGGFFALRVWGLIIGEAYTRRGLFSEFYGIRERLLRLSILLSISSRKSFHPTWFYMSTHSSVILRFLLNATN